MIYQIKEKLPCADAHGSFVYLTAAAANENDDKSDDDPPNVVVAEKVAKTVIHNISSVSESERAVFPFSVLWYVGGQKMCNDLSKYFYSR